MAVVATLGIVGLGLVGRALAVRAQAGGLAVVGHDVMPASVDAARALGIAICDTLDGLTGRDALLIAVFDDAQLEDVVGRVLAGAVKPRILVHCVTADPALSVTLAAVCDAAGVVFAEAPLSGSSQQIAAGEALALVGTSDAGWTAVQPLIELLSPEAVHVGPPGAGARAKLATNLVLGLNRAVLAEGILFAETLGLDGPQFLDLLRRSPAYSRAVDTVGPRMIAGDFAPVSRLRQHHKDVRLMLAAAAAAGIDLPFSRAHAAVLTDAEAQGKGDLDNGAILAALRDRR
jgi:3-hydroxyisobutyrate dehydrogenase-like beta-hydroxyacid dehydrogenase